MDKDIEWFIRDCRIEVSGKEEHAACIAWIKENNVTGKSWNGCIVNCSLNPMQLGYSAAYWHHDLGIPLLVKPLHVLHDRVKLLETKLAATKEDIALVARKRRKL